MLEAHCKIITSSFMSTIGLNISKLNIFGLSLFWIVFGRAIFPSEIMSTWRVSISSFVVAKISWPLKWGHITCNSKFLSIKIKGEHSAAIVVSRAFVKKITSRIIKAAEIYKCLGLFIWEFEPLREWDSNILVRVHYF